MVIDLPSISHPRADHFDALDTLDAITVRGDERFTLAASRGILIAYKRRRARDSFIRGNDIGIFIARVLCTSQSFHVNLPAR